MATSQQQEWTGGTWEVEFGDVPYGELGEAWQVNCALGSICTVDSPGAYAEGIARLIAAAPALFKALEDFDNWFCGFDPEDRASRMEGRKVVIRARAALAAARPNP